MAHIYVIAGHGAGDSGACGHGYQEQERVRALAQRIKDFGGDSVTLHSFADNAYASGAINRLSIPKDWQVVELHMDSAGAGARGGHVIYSAKFSPDQYDKALADSISAIFPGRANKLVGRSDLANVNRAAKRGISYRLVENGFISDAGDVAIFNSRIDDIARAYLRAFGINAGSAPAQPTPPQPAPAEAEVDGKWGGDTTRALQKALGTYVDGVVSDQASRWRGRNPGLTTGWEWHDRTTAGSNMIRALQRKVGAGVDGVAGADTFRALQRYLGTYQDGVIDYPSNCVKEMQRRLNAGTF